MSIFKDSFHIDIRNQLNVRQTAINKRTPQNLQYYNSRNAWIRLSSSVNVYSGTGDKKDPKNYTADLSRKNVLQGGVLANYNKGQGNLKSGIGENGAYSSYERLGIRPMPGITSVDIKSQGAYGSLRSATVNFQCWDIKQLEDLELLYMRPGYTVLLEWGWVPYLDNSGSLQTNFIDYTDIIDTDWTKEELFALQYAKSTDGKYKKPDGTQVNRVGYKGNYDSMFGSIKNYSWKARMDGGYDCVTEIISLGEVMESLKVNYAPLDNINTITSIGFITPNLEAEKLNISAMNLSGSYSQNVLAGIFTEMYNIGLQFGANTPAESEENGIHTIVYDKKYKTYYDIFRKKINLNSNDDKKNATSTGNISQTDQQVYITLETLTHLLNNYVLLRDKKAGKPFSSISVLERNTAAPNPINGDGYLLGLAHPLQISVDPTVCLIKSSLWLNGINVVSDTGNTADPNQGKPAVRPSNADSLKNRFSNTSYVDVFNKMVELDADETIGKSNLEETIIDLLASKTGRQPDEFREFQRQYLLIKEEVVDKGLNTVPGEVFGVNTRFVNWIKNKKYSNAYNLLDSFLITTEFLSLAINKTFFISGIEDSDNYNFVKDALTLKPNESKAKEEQTKIERQQQQIRETNKKLQEGLKNIQFLKQLARPYFIPASSASERGPDWKSELGIIGNIYVNVSMLYNLCTNDQLASQDKKEKNEIALYDFMKNVLSQISTAIGNVNNLDIFVDPVDNVARIIDINYADRVKATQAYDNAFELQVQNLNSVVRSYNLESKIFKEQSTIVAIGAQIGGATLGTDTSTLVDFNRSIIDRIIPVKDAPTTNETQDNQSKLSILITSLNIIANFFTDLSYYKFLGITTLDSDFNIDKATEYTGALRDLINFFKALGKGKSKNKAILPTVLNIEMDGIGGIIIGNLFRIPPEVLPKGYKNDGAGSKLGYTVTGIGHSLQNNDWVTKLEAQTIILDEPEGYDIDYSTIQLSSANTSGTTIVVGAGGVVTAEKAKTYYPEKPEEQFKRTFIPQTQLASYLKKKIATGLNKNIAIAVMAKSINEQGSGDQLRGFNNNFYGVQTDSARWPAKYDPFISGNVFIAENKTNKQRAFAAFSTPEIGADFVIENVQRRGIYVGGTTTYITKGTKITDATLWAKIYYKEWVTGNKNAEPDIATLKNLLSIYDRAAKLIG